MALGHHVVSQLRGCREGGAQGSRVSGNLEDCKTRSLGEGATQAAPRKRTGRAPVKLKGGRSADASDLFFCARSTTHPTVLLHTRPGRGNGNRGRLAVSLSLPRSGFSE